MQPPLVLASTSPYRRALLERLTPGFRVARPGVDEAPRACEAPEARAMRLAAEKANAVAEAEPGAVVIGSDQVAVAEGHILDKPGDEANARRQLARLSSASASFHTACVVMRRRDGLHLSHLDTTRVVFRALTAAEIERYVARERPFDCAGSFKAEALGISLLQEIDSRDPTALIGLPLIWLAGALRTAGYLLP